MKFKKGFTLAEILIVLMVIGVLATLTIPSLMKGVQEAQYKTAYRKAYNNVVSMMAAEKVSSGLPAIWVEEDEVIRCYFFDTLRKYVSIKAWVPKKEEGGILINSGTALDKSFIKTDMSESESRYQWLISEDGIAYTIASGGCATPGKCTVANINAQSTFDKAYQHSTFMVLVDVNGLQSLPNRYSKKDNLGDSATPQLDADQFFIFVGSDGATAGNSTQLLTGRIVNNIK